VANGLARKAEATEHAGQQDAVAVKGVPPGRADEAGPDLEEALPAAPQEEVRPGLLQEDIVIGAPGGQLLRSHVQFAVGEVRHQAGGEDARQGPE